MHSNEREGRPVQPTMELRTEQHIVTYPTCDVCGQSHRKEAVEFRHYQSNKDGPSYVLVQPLIICRQCLLEAVGLQAPRAACTYCGK